MKSKAMNPVLDFINTLYNFVALNLVFLITCLPVITIGTALSSLYYVTLREARGEYGYLVRTYLREFKNNFKKGTIAFAILFLIAAMIGWFLIFTYTFPLIGRFENSTKQTLKNAFGLAMSNMKATFALIIIDAFVFSLCLFLSPMKLLMVLFGFAFVAYCQSFVFKKVFEPYEAEQIAPENTEI